MWPEGRRITKGSWVSEPLLRLVGEGADIATAGAAHYSNRFGQLYWE